MSAASSQVQRGLRGQNGQARDLAMCSVVFLHWAVVIERFRMSPWMQMVLL